MSSDFHATCPDCDEGFLRVYTLWFIVEHGRVDAGFEGACTKCGYYRKWDGSLDEEKP